MASQTTSGSLPARQPFAVQRGLLGAVRVITRFATRQPLGFAGGAIVTVFVFLAIFADVVAPYDPHAIDLRARLQGPSSAHWLGTDQVGHDVLSRLIYGARLSLMIGFGAVIISSSIATVLGLLSAYIGGWLDTIMQRFIDAWIALPDLVILITFAGIVRRIPDANMIMALLFALAFLRIAPATRLIRSVVLELRGRPFIEAAESAGATPLRAMVQHVLPNVFPLIFITATVALPGAILAEAALSFLGLGPAGEASWGQMLSVDGRDFFRRQPGLAIWPGVAIALSVFGFNMFGDALRDILDPRLRGRR
ncbi:MAG: ABC transporter permease [Dehalococcoidia bacterium]